MLNNMIWIRNSKSSKLDPEKIIPDPQHYTVTLWTGARYVMFLFLEDEHPGALVKGQHLPFHLLQDELLSTKG